MRPSTRSRHQSETPDAVGHIVALLVRFPEIATLVSHPNDGTLTLSFAVTGRLDRAAERDLRDVVDEHVRSLAALCGETVDALEVVCEPDSRMSFVRITRDARTFSRDELALLTALLADRFGAALVMSPVAEDDSFEDDGGVSDELVDDALELLRDPSSQRSLVGFREEKRVFVYFVTARKKPKSRARS